MDKSENKKEGKCLLKDKRVWISGIIGIFLGIVILYLVSILFDFSITNKVKRLRKNAKITLNGIDNDAVAVLDNGQISQTDLYNDMKNYYNIASILEIIDSKILNEKYELTQEQEEKIKKEAEDIIEQYGTHYGYTEEQFLASNSFNSKEDFINYLKLDYKRNLCYLDYLKTIISKKEIEDYYNSNDIYGDISTKYMFIQTEENSEDALNTANEIISKLNNGEKFDDVANEYSNSVLSQELSFNSFDEDAIINSYSQSYIDACKSLDKETYTKEAIESGYGYFVIYCIDKNEKPSLEECEEDILTKLSADEENEDANLRYKVLIELREDANLKFIDEKLDRDYKEYCDSFNN